jgi:hypothetical protein
VLVTEVPENVTLPATSSVPTWNTVIVPPWKFALPPTVTVTFWLFDSLKSPNVNVRLPFTVTLLLGLTCPVVDFAISRLAPIVPGPSNAPGVDDTKRISPPPAIEPLTDTFRLTSSWKLGAIVRVAPTLTVRSRHAALKTPDVDGLFGVPAGMTASTPLLGTPALQFPDAFQLELPEPFQVV